MKSCPKCGKEFPDEANFCPKDAGRLVAIGAGAAGTSKDEAADALPADGLYGKRFKQGERIGGGRTGAVYEAVDTESGRAVALKLVDPAVFPTPLTLQRTERELKQLERLDAEGVAKVVGYGRHNGQLWIASELLGGSSLDQMVAAQGPLPLEQATEIVVSIGRALGESARAGVVHRDLAPKNVMVDGGQVKLINFGVPQPESGGAQGVPEFVSPEQVDGKPVDQRSNIYSLGAIHYFLLTGRAPFIGTPAEVLEQHRSATPAPPSTLASLPQTVDTVVLKSLEKSSSKRFMTLRQFLEQVESAAAGNPGGTQKMGGAQSSNSKNAAKTKNTAKTMMGGFALEEGDGESSSSAADALAPRPTPRVTAPMSQADAAGAVQAAAQVEELITGPDGVHGAPEPVVAAAAEPSAEAPEPAAPEPAAAVAAAPVAAAAVAAAPVAAAPEPAAPVAAAQQQQPIAASGAGASRSNPGGKGGSKAKKRKSKSKKGSKNKFRETMWFKKGALDEQAASQAATAAEGALVSDKADEMPIEDRYADDGSLSARDQESFSLRTGHTQAMAAIAGDVPSKPRGEVSEDELIGEMKSGRGLLFAIIGAALVIVVGLVVFLATR